LNHVVITTAATSADYLLRNWQSVRFWRRCHQGYSLARPLFGNLAADKDTAQQQNGDDYVHDG
jgi:hypothetical protein